MKYGRIYGAGYRNTTASTVASKELAHILSSSSSVTLIHEVHITAISTLNAVADYSIAWAATTNAVGTTVAITPFDAADAAFRGNVYGVTSSASTGLTYVGGSQQACNILTGYHFMPIPENRPVIKPGGRVVIRRESAISDDVALDVSIILEEIGG